MDTAKVLGRRIRLRRTERGWSRRELAIRSGVNFHMIGRYETGAVAIPAAVVVRLANALECTPNDLLLGLESEAA